jgi:hypothetical protein
MNLKHNIPLALARKSKNLHNFFFLFFFQFQFLYSVVVAAILIYYNRPYLFFWHARQLILYCDSNGYPWGITPQKKEKNTQKKKLGFRAPQYLHQHQLVTFLEEFQLKIIRSKVTLSSPSLSVGLLSPPLILTYPLFKWYPQSNEILLNLRMKYWNSAFNAQCWRLIIVVVQLRAAKIYLCSSSSSGGA